MPPKKKNQTRGKGPRVSRRLQGLPAENNIHTTPLRAIDIPIELQNTIIGALPKSDLKNVRLVCHQWGLLAVNFLFDKVYISASKKDLDIFRMVSEHDTICKAVTMLVYDVTTFSHVSSLEEYIVLFITDMSDIFSIYGNGRRKVFKNPTKPFHRLINTLSDLGGPNGSELDEYENDDYILEGYRTWMSHAEYEHYSMEGLLLGTLRSGLSKMPRLHSVTLTSNIFTHKLLEMRNMDQQSLDPDTPPRQYTGSPLSRTWNHLHARPDHHNNVSETIQRHLETLLFALVRNGPPTILNLSLLADLNPLSLLPNPSPLRRQAPGGLVSDLLKMLNANDILHKAVLQAFHGLESFSLRIQTASEPDEEDRFGMLPELLEDMKQLKHLRLDISGIGGVYFCKEVFNKDAKWVQMESLHVSGVSFGEKEFVCLVREQMPKLRRLEICPSSLLKGTWGAVVKALPPGVCVEELGDRDGGGGG
ncbi:MAG: hypothetical protein Q9195_001210 [Heterodermia aff. obscurata]